MSDNPHLLAGMPPPGDSNGPGLGGGFAVGTLVHTDKGLVPIEKIQVGDRVLARPNVTSEPAWRRVIGTSVRDGRTMERVMFESPDDSLSELSVLINGHQPFWVVDAGWTPARALRTGARLRLADGREVEVLARRPVWRTEEPHVAWVGDGFGPEGCEIDFSDNLNVLREIEFDEELLDDDAGDPFFHGRVYGLEVEDLHAFQVGRLGVWVHDIDCGASAAGDTTPSA